MPMPLRQLSSSDPRVNERLDALKALCERLFRWDPERRLYVLRVEPEVTLFTFHDTLMDCAGFPAEQDILLEVVAEDLKDHALESLKQAVERFIEQERTIEGTAREVTEEEGNLSLPDGKNRR